MNRAIAPLEETFRLLLDSSHDWEVFRDAEENLVYSNQGLDRIFGYSREDYLSGRIRFDDLFFEEDLPRARATFRRARKGKAVSEVETRARKKDGSAVYLSVSARPVTRDNAFLGVRTSVRDITRRKQAEEKLLHSENRFKNIFDNASDGILIADTELRIFDGNERICGMLGYTRDELKSMGIREIHPGNDWPQVLRQFRALAEGETNLVRNVPVMRKNGSVFFADINSSHLQLEGRLHVMGTFRDVSKIMLMEQQRKTLESQLNQAQKMQAVGTLAGGIAHDFNNVLAPILGYAEMVRLEVPEDSPSYESLGEIIRAALRAKGLVKQILTFGRDMGEKREPIDMAAITEEVVGFIRASLPSFIQIITYIDKDCGFIIGDSTRVHQVIMNLCTNASHAMQQKGGTLGISLERVIKGPDHNPILKPGPYARLTVSDTGHGISSEIIDRVFEPYFTTKDVGEGSGMGLAVSHAIVTKLGGDIKVRSVPETGTLFDVYFPLHEKTQARIPEKEETPPVHGTEHILLVDDEPGLLDMGTQLLETLGYKVTAAPTGSDAWKIFQAGTKDFDLVLTDMTMPGMTGDVLAEKILASPDKIPVILCTGFSEKLDAKGAGQMGIAAFIEKPFAMGKLAATIRRALDDPKGPA